VAAQSSSNSRQVIALPEKKGCRACISILFQPVVFYALCSSGNCCFRMETIYDEQKQSIIAAMPCF
jgi:hypothetical protein